MRQGGDLGTDGLGGTVPFHTSKSSLVISIKQIVKLLKTILTMKKKISEDPQVGPMFAEVHYLVSSGNKECLTVHYGLQIGLFS